ncbi:MAG: hypothetical protein M1817_005804 [Caeruleum heppii]|nr:MAG: hypothetical protein M1817_005804 [Caeruleum heppii]
MEFFQDDFHWTSQAREPLHFVVVGAGIGGLTAGIGLTQTGHRVTILEQAPEISEVGAGILVAPNAARIFGRLGLLEQILDQASPLERNSLRRWENDKELGIAPLMPQVGHAPLVVGARYKAPLAVIHRGDLQRSLLEAAVALKIIIRTDARVVGVDSDFGPLVKLESGEWVKADVVVGADGIKSIIRQSMLAKRGIIDKSTPTGDAAYRIIIPEERMKGNQHAMALLKSNVGMRWMGPQGHIMAYPIKRNTVYNMVLLHPQKPGSTDDESWTRKGDKQEMLDFYAGWNDVVKDLMTYAPEGEVTEWTLNSHHPLPSWVENKIVLMGDACHPMLPYVAQGAAQAVEDAGVLAVCFSKTSDVRLGLAVYETLRKGRSEAIQASAATTRLALHLPDGPEQEARDQKMKIVGQNSDMWADQNWQGFMYGTDVMREAHENWLYHQSHVQGRNVRDQRSTANL